MADFFTLGTEARLIVGSPENPQRVINRGASNVGRNTTSAVVVTDNALTTGQSVTITSAQWFVSAASSGIMVEPSTFALGSTSVGGALAVSGTTTIAGVTTLTGGVGDPTTKARALPAWTYPPQSDTTLAATSATDSAAADNKTVYLASLFVPQNCTVTGIAVLNGTNITTDKFVNYLINAAGTVIGKTAAAGTAPTPADVYQETDLTAPLTIVGPAVYFIGRQHNGATITLQKIPASKGVYNLTGSVAGTSFGAETSVVPPTAFAADKGPYGFLY